MLFFLQRAILCEKVNMAQHWPSQKQKMLKEGDFDLKSFAMAPEDALKQKFTKYALDLNKNASMGLKVCKRV